MSRKRKQTQDEVLVEEDEEIFVPTQEQLLDSMARLLLRCRTVLSAALSQVGLVEDISAVLKLADVHNKAHRKNGVH